MENNSTGNSRRDFIKKSATALAALTIVPSSVVSGLGHQPPSDKLNLAAIGIGGVGFKTLNNLKNENIVALCDVDWDYAQKSFRRCPLAPRFTDFREMFDKTKSIDGVIISTPDHTHASAALIAIQQQKHVYVQAPMAHSVYEMRKMNANAKTFSIVSQVGNQGASSDETRQIAEWIWAGTIGEVKTVHAWTSAPKWKQGITRPEKSAREPKTLNWDLFIGSLYSKTEYNQTYTPFGWRAWWEFGNGALGSMGPHILEPVFRALKLNAPVSIEASATGSNLESAPIAQKIVFEFDQRDNLPKVAMPPVKLTWYDGGLMPERPAGIAQDIRFGDETGGLIFEGSKGIIVCGTSGANCKIYLNGIETEVKATRIIPRITNPYEGGHEYDWIRACKESPENRLYPSATFSESVAMTETILVGALAVRLRQLNRKLLWDSAQMKFLSISDTETIDIVTDENTIFENGVPNLKTKETTVNAKRFVEQAVRPIYRIGWDQL